MLTTRLLRTSSFQIALLYLTLFGATLLALLAFVYWSTAGLIDRQMSDTVEAEIRGLGEQYRDEGLSRLVEVIGERSGRNGDPSNVYLLADPGLKPLAGNLSRWPEVAAGADRWLEVRLHRLGDEQGNPHTIRGRMIDLPSGLHLFVGRDTEERGDFRDIVMGAMAWALIPALVLGLVGGVLIGRYSLRRVDMVRATGQEIINGDLSRRVPLSGSGDEFDRLALTINEMLDQIETLMAGMRAVTDSLAHDLRSPLTRAKGSIEQALRTAAGDYRQALEQTGAELETILRTFDSLINIAQAEAGINRLTIAELDLSALVGDLAEVYQPIAEDAGLELGGDVAAGVSIRGHRELLGQAIANLLDNAIKYTPAGGRIAIVLDRAGGAPRLAIADSGPGVPTGERARVLERFVRLDSSRGTPGSGLGLSLVAAVAKLHGARLALADNAPGLSITLTFAGAAAAPRRAPAERMTAM